MWARSGSPGLRRKEANDLKRAGVSAMSTLTFGTASRQRFGMAAAEPKPEASSSLDMAWLVLEAANDLGDHDAVEACRRVIDANLKGRLASQSDEHLVVDYFR